MAEFRSLAVSGGKVPSPPPPVPHPVYPERSWASDGKYSLGELASWHKDPAGHPLSPYRLIGTSARHGTLLGAFGRHVDLGGRVGAGKTWASSVPAGGAG